MYDNEGILVQPDGYIYVKIYLDAEWEFDGFSVEGKGYDNGALAVQDLINGNINYVIIDAAPAQMIAANFNALS
mgnify:CR=1 FL=1